MPAGKNPKPSDEITAPMAHEPDGAEPMTNAPEDDAPDGDVSDVPMNRAERRAKGKAGSQPKAAGKIQPGRVNPGHMQRQWASRRSGG